MTRALGLALLSGVLMCGGLAPAGAEPICGHFAVLGCFKDMAAARKWSRQINAGEIIDTTSNRYPNFRPGFFCVVTGPTSKSEATTIVNGWRGIIPDAYAKNSCN